MNLSQAESCPPNFNASTTVDSALSLCDIFKEAGTKHKDFHMANNSSITCVSAFSSESPAERSTACKPTNEALATEKQYHKEPHHKEPSHRSSIDGESFTIKLNDADSSAVPTQKQRLFAETRKEKAEKHIYSHPAMLAALIELDSEDD